MDGVAWLQSFPPLNHDWCISIFFAYSIGIEKREDRISPIRMVFSFDGLRSIASSLSPSARGSCLARCSGCKLPRACPHFYFHPMVIGTTGYVKAAEQQDMWKLLTNSFWRRSLFAAFFPCNNSWTRILRQRGKMMGFCCCSSSSRLVQSHVSVQALLRREAGIASVTNERSGGRVRQQMLLECVSIDCHHICLA